MRLQRLTKVVNLKIHRKIIAPMSFPVGRTVFRASDHCGHEGV